MLIFLDSSILCADYYMRGTYFELLKRATGVYIILSEIVLDEVKNKHKEMIIDGIQSVNKEIVELNRILSSSLQLIREDAITKELSEYSDFIEMFLIESGATIAEPYPKIEHRDIVERALLRKKPFKNDGKNGYRDFLVWKTFLQVAKSHPMETVCFITLNKKDFSDTKDDKLLHPDLLMDIDEVGIERDRIQYWTSLKDFVEKVIKPQLKENEENEKFSESLLSDEEGFVNPLENTLTEKITGIDLNGHDVLAIGENPSLAAIEEIFNTEIQEISKLSDVEYLLEIQVDTICSVESYIFKSELATMSEDDLGDTQIVNSNWNDHYVLAETSIGLKIDLEIIFDVSKKVFMSFDISDISDYSCIYCD